MNQPVLDRFRKVVPRSIQVAASLVFVVALFCAMYFIYASGSADAQLHRGVSPQTHSVAAIACIALCSSLFIAGWLLALGYVYGDAKRRGMPAGLWTLIVLFTPNLIGFLFYFAMRKPLLAICSNCGNGVSSDQHFCSNCGAAQSFFGGSPSAGAPSSPAPSSPAPSGPGSAFKSYAAVAQTLSAPRAFIQSSEIGSPQSSGVSLKSFAVGFSVWTGIFLSKALFAFLKHDRLDSAVLLGFALIGVGLVLLANKKPIAAR